MPTTTPSTLTTIEPGTAHGARLRVEYVQAPLRQILESPDVLAVFGFGDAAPAGDSDPRYLRLNLQPDGGTAPFEVWRGQEPVRHGRVEGGLAWAEDGQLMFGALALEESACGGIAAAAEAAYDRLLDFLARSGFDMLLKAWNYIDAITHGEGDGERYRQFCVGRERGLRGRLPRYPAATAIGSLDGRRVLQVYWLAAREPGQPLENPRQVSAWHYPREYGPQSPGFARAMLPASPAVPLLLSGTASVVGHASMHAGDLGAQLDEIRRNLESLLQVARAQRPSLPMALGESSLARVYVRQREDLPRVRDALASRLPATVPRMLLVGEVCRRDLLVEIDGFHG